MKTPRGWVSFAAAAWFMWFAAAEGAPAPAKLTFGAASNLGNALMYISVDKGFFAKHGIDAKLRIIETGPALSKSLDAGELDISIAALSNIPVALERGLKARALLAFTGAAYTQPADDNVLAIVVRPDSGINTLEDLKGKKVGVSFGNTNDMYLQEMLRKNRIPPSALDRLNVAPSNSVSLFDTGGVAAMVMWEPYNTMMLDKVKGSRLLVRGGGYVCFCSQVHGLPPTVYKDRDVTQRVVDAMAEAASYLRDPKNLDDVSQIAARYIRGLDVDIVKRTLKYASFDPRLGKNTFKAFNIAVEQLIAQKKMKAPFDPAKYYDTSFIQRTMERHPEWFKDLPRPQEG
ncbi:MAG: ABC transporter substrate-binding protein [Nitrospinota bacterium]